ncbi:rhodanese-like domain-containing protein [Salipiger mangrovisoli]|uniref:Rhodanese-like domain-containing protein n=1 Tax=Salipiger mangrovisoli TaxID=2865933 RepID=A0ABR9X1U0_9RHOB|nr:rhodanese-like domain-containing protein [Salipiger mangrovisoli]MBE9637471.1 rhodanese-like domain-containing protein [Salipiger mangrovisoli]
MSNSFNTRLEEARAAVPSIAAGQAASRHGRGALFVDPRPPEAIAKTTGRIPSALIVPLDRLEAGDIPTAISGHRGEVITACQAGPMGAIAAHALVKAGIARVAFLENGTQGWIDAGHPTER